jgi:hypothetical protein
MTVVGSQLYVAVSNQATKQYKLCLFTLLDGKLNLDWEVEGKGYHTRISQVFETKYIVAGSDNSVLLLIDLSCM